MKKKLSSFHEHKIDNYIDRKNNPKWPKPDGYRGIHITYKYFGDRQEYHGLFLEVQLRTKFQHYRATALEMIDLMQESKIKEGEWEQILKDFFKWSSVILENLEWNKTSNKKKAIKNLKDILQQIDVLDILNKRVVSYWILYDVGLKKISITWDMILEITKESSSKINITPHYNKTIEELKSIYLKLEKQYEKNPIKDIVYLSSEEIENAYPNYTWSAEQFINILKRELKIK